MSLLQVAGVSKQQSGVFIVNDISFTQQPSQKIAIAGETGSGKSTLLKMIAGLLQPDAGEVLFDHKRVEGPNEKLIPGHPRIAYLSQHFELRNNYRVEEILSYANMLTAAAATAIYEVCRIDHLLKRRTDQLSGGEKQRIALSRLLIGSPALLLLDEPFSNLDMIHKSILKAVVRDIAEKLQITCMLVSHDPQDILSWADTILIIKEGRIIQQGTPKQVYSRPVNEYAGGLLGRYNIIAMEGKAIFIRPEHIALTKDATGTLKGKVSKLLYYGSYAEMEISFSGQSVTVRAGSNTIKAGDTVYMTLDPEGIWYF